METKEIKSYSLDPGKQIEILEALCFQLGIERG
jgi:hypothetical protein